MDDYFFSAKAVVPVPNALSQRVQHTGGLQRRVAGFHGILILALCPVCCLNSKYASQFLENLMANFKSNAQLLEQVMLWTSR